MSLKEKSLKDHLLLKKRTVELLVETVCLPSAGEWRLEKFTKTRRNVPFCVFGQYWVDI